MSTRALAIACLVMVLGGLPGSRAHAHGPPPSPLSLLAADDEGARAVRLSRGIALREPAGMRFVCPAVWGAVDTGLVVAGAIPDGPLAVAGATSISLIADDGTVTPHPDAQALGRVIAFAASSSALYALQVRDDQSELIEVGSDGVRLLWSDAQAWNDLAVSDSELMLLRLGTADMVQLELTLAGATKAERQALAPEMTAAVFARLVGSTPYVLAASQGGALLELGRVEDGAFDVLQSARGNLAGPVDTAGGARFIAIEGVLNRFDDDEPAPLGDPEFVTCLDAAHGLRYACTRTQIRALGDDGLGAALFDVSELLEPDAQRIPAALKADCDAQWQHYRFDLLAAGIPLASERDGDAGVDAGVDAGATFEADAAVDAGVDAGSADATSGHPEHHAGTGGGGCSVSEPRRARSSWPATCCLALLGLALGRTRRAGSRAGSR